VLPELDMVVAHKTDLRAHGGRRTGPGPQVDLVVNLTSMVGFGVGAGYRAVAGARGQENHLRGALGARAPRALPPQPQPPRRSNQESDQQGSAVPGAGVRPGT
jgi:hypothetical protein